MAVRPNPLDVFSHHGKVCMSVRIFMTGKKTGTFGWRPGPNYAGATGQNTLKIIKPGLSRRNRK